MDTPDTLALRAEVGYLRQQLQSVEDILVGVFDVTIAADAHSAVFAAVTTKRALTDLKLRCFDLSAAAQRA